MTRVSDMRGPLGQKGDKPAPDPDYLGWVKQLPCAVCKAPPPSDAHHPICGRYSQRKAPDTDAIPLCKRHHQHGPLAIHNGKRSWIARFGMDTDYIEPTRKAVEAMKNSILGRWF